MVVNTRRLRRDAVAAVRAIREAIVDLRDARTDGRFPSVISATTAMLSLADSGDIGAAAAASSQPAWRVIGWANQIATSDYPTEVISTAYLPPAYVGFSDAHLLLAGVTTDPDLRLDQIVIPGEIELNGLRDFGFDMSPTVVWIVHTSCSYALSLVNDLREAQYTFEQSNSEMPDGSVKALHVQVIGNRDDPDVVNLSIDLLSLLMDTAGVHIPV